ncbi:metallopeptidase TldD-related protein [Ideonella sp.]|uniref:metallopeptidase TldD-related protein n=1 Tax=Ideonella sp. TaxID=1929293 RepID=UPI002B46D362|nr:metallopeptidase TldD-related protein [Ideonella sp.]HJV70410.1 metallopeptidase TldD-related protein [Ideonella sp.]
MARRDFDPTLRDQAQKVLALMHSQGFDQVQVGVGWHRQSELNVAHNEPSLMRSTAQSRLSLLGLLDGRRASTELSSLDDEAVRHAIAQLFEAAQAAPQDAANAVSSGQQASIVRGPLEAEPALLADTMAALLDFRARETPRFTIEEGAAAHHLSESHLLTTGGSELAWRAGWLSLSAFGTAREGERASSFNFAGGDAHGFAGQPAQDWFGIGRMMRDTSQQILAQPFGTKFVGEVVLTPQAVGDLLGWLLGQLGDAQLIAGSSLYRERVGAAIASPLVGLRSRFEAPGVVPVSADACCTPPVEVLREGRLLTLLPSLYGSRKTGLAHVPTAAAGWEMAAGAAPLTQVVGEVGRGAIVGRLSMGMPAANGDFSGVIKNSFRIDDGVVGPALSEVMISGNMAGMLKDVLAVSRERLDTGSTMLPWLRIGGLHFS